jgi:pantoate--beta-alanine ligase
MGALHEGHSSLLSLARTQCDVVILTVFVNPTQFGPSEDYRQYPRDFERDERIAREAGTDIVFTPDVAEMYPDGFLTYIVTEEAANTLEGKIRPTHFRGVTTVVAKLFHATKPHVAVFGQKDAQQLFVIRAMVRDLNFDVELLAAPIVRESDGLAISSRNVYLNKTERTAASSLYRSLATAGELIGSGERNLRMVRDTILGTLAAASSSEVDYVAFVDTETFREVEDLDGGSVLILLAVRFGSTRLIDNIFLPLK